MKLRLGTRGSDLARTQSGHIATALAAHGIETEFVIISTSGDRSTAPTFGAIGAQGVFVREIEQALLDNEIDLAVHSYKDLPTSSPANLTIAAIPPRRDPADWLFLHAGAADASAEGFGRDTPEEHPCGSAPAIPGRRRSRPKPSALTSAVRLVEGARIGTASARRSAWVRHLRPDLVIRSLRGNVPTRLKRLVDGDFDGILLAGAGVERLAEATDVLTASLGLVEGVRLEPEVFVPAPSQGALAVQCRVDAVAIREALARIDDAATRAAVSIERAALALAEGGCDTAFGAYARPGAGGMVLTVMLERDGRVLQATVRGVADAELAVRGMAALDASDVSDRGGAR